MSHDFEKYLKIWVLFACKEWGYPEPPDKYYADIYRRVPEGAWALLGSGIKDGLIITKGDAFTVQGLLSDKGPWPYHWFSRCASTRVPAPNWEWFVHVAEFVRLYKIGVREGFRLVYEDKLMDLTLYRDEKLLVYCEVKERASRLQKLVKGIKFYQQGIDYTDNDRGNDPLRKAKCIASLKPEYFSGVAIGARLEYKVTYPENQAFQLTRDMIPWI